MYISCSGDESNDQATAESFWAPGHIQNTPEDDSSSSFVQPEDYFPSAHGLVQTHPASFSGFGSTQFKLYNSIKNKCTLNKCRRFTGISESTHNNLPPLGYSSLDFDKRGLDELRKNPELSSPEECARACREGEPPRICYYHFTAELYNVLGA